MDISDNTQKTDSKGQDHNSLFYRCVSYAKACYLVSSLIKDNEPIKSQIRKVSNSLIEDISNFAYVQKSGGASEPVLLAARERFSELTIFLNLAFISHLISKMNYDILKGEGDKILVNFDIILGDHLRVGMLSSDFFSGLKKGDRDSLLLPSVTTPVLPSTPTFTTKGGVGAGQSIGQQKHKAVEVGIGDKGSSADARGRKDRIMSFMKGKTRLSVTDIAAHIKDCSEKTIQRDLIELVDRGLVVRDGERRWSRYTIVS